jgi:hypothetical protein
MAASAALAALVFGPSLAMATDADVERQLNDMQQRMQQMEDKLQATSDQLDSANARVDEQSQVIENAGLAETRGTSNGLPGFLGQIKVGGWVAASYFWNTNDPQDHDLGGLQGTNSGLNGRFYPFHPDHNSFALDQVWFEIEREINEENRGGFRFDTAYGKTAALLTGPNNRDQRDDSAIYISQGYVQYLAPVGDGLTFKFGKFNTLLGTEVAQSPYNWNITRSSVYNLLEPIDHIGILASYAFGDSGFDAAIGGVNGFRPDDPDRNDAKSVLGHLGWAGDNVTVGLNGIYGAENTGQDGHETGVVNALVKLNATERLAFWLNGDYAWQHESDAAAWGVAAAGRFGITDRTGISLRGEYVADVDGFLGFVGQDPLGTIPLGDGSFGSFTGIETWGITATVDHLLTDNLMIRGEVRYDNINKDSTNNDEFFQNSSDDGFNLDNDQLVLGVEAIYNFNKFGGE